MEKAALAIHILGWQGGFFLVKLRHDFGNAFAACPQDLNLVFVRGQAALVCGIDGQETIELGGFTTKKLGKTDRSGGVAANGDPVSQRRLRDR